MPGLPKKFAKMGFKKGWAAFRRTKKNRKGNTKTRRVSTVAKKTARRKTSKSLRFMGHDIASTIVLPGVYGAARGRISQIVLPIADKLPLKQFAGGVADEVAMLGALGLAHKFIKNPTVRKGLRAGMMIEAAQIGAALATGQLGLRTAPANTGQMSFR